MDNKRTLDVYDDGNIPETDLPRHSTGDLELHISDRFYDNKKEYKKQNSDNAERLPESTRPRQDGPGGA